MNQFQTQEVIKNKSREEMLKTIPYRRFSSYPDHIMEPADFCQPYDIDILSKNKKILLGNLNESYYMHTLDSMQQDLEEKTLQAEINKICLRPKCDVLTIDKKIEEFSKIIYHLKNKYGKHLYIIIDPFSLAIYPDLTWGIKSNGSIDPEASLSLLSDAAISFASAGVDGFLTIGRINFEVDEVFKKIKSSNFDTKILSFSTNPETAYAYINTTLHDPKKSNTGQKIIVGNIGEMVLRALLDLMEGTSILIQKPLSSYHLTSYLSLILSGDLDINYFIDQPVIKAILEKNELLHNKIIKFKKSIHEIRHNKLIGGYSISGNYAVTRLIEKEYNSELAMAFLHEEYINMKAAAASCFYTIIDRNANWYLNNRGSYLGIY